MYVYRKAFEEIIITTTVDDIVCASSSMQLEKDFVKAMRARYECTHVDLPQAPHALGLDITYNTDSTNMRSISIDDAVHHAGMDDAPQCKTW